MERWSILRSSVAVWWLLMLLAGLGVIFSSQKGVVSVILLFAVVLGGSRLQAAPTVHSRFLRRFMLAGGLFLLGVGGFNYIMNPLGIYSTHFFEPIIFASRNQKMNLFSAFTPAPQVLILGSSRSFTVDPTQVEALWGYRTFNASLTGGGTRDYLAFTRYALQTGADLKLLIVNVAVESFQKLDLSTVEPDSSLWDYLENDPIRSLSTSFDQITRLFSKQQTDASLRLLNVERNGRPAPAYRFDARGQGYFYAPNPLDTAVENDIQAGWRHVFIPDNYDFTSVIGTFEQFLELCRDHNIKVIGYMPPYHPTLLHLVESEYDYTALHAKFVEALHDFEATYEFSFIDFVHSQLLSSTEATFVDGVHPTPEASAKMMETLHEAFPLLGRQP